MGKASTGPEFVVWWWGGQPGKYYFLGRKDENGEWRQRAFKRSEMGKVAAWLERYEDNDLYFCPHGFERDIRRAEYASEVHCFYCDHDLADPDRGPPPSFLIRTSPGRHQGLWQTTSHVTQQQNERLTAFLKADPSGADRTQMLRVPGTTNWKEEYDEPTVRVVSATGRVWEPAKVLYDVPAASARAVNATRLLGPASRPRAALSIVGYEGVSAEDVIRRLRVPIRKYMGPPFRQKASDVLWRIECEVRDAAIEQDLGDHPHLPKWIAACAIASESFRVHTEGMTGTAAIAWLEGDVARCLRKGGL